MIWWTGDRPLAGAAAAAIRSPDNEKFVSAASICEAEITLQRHHGDPFDRMLVAQAQLEGLTIVTRDPVFDHYPVAVLRA